MTDSHASKEWAPFDKDVAGNEGYLYTTNSSMSSKIANKRQSEAILASADFRGQRVIDIGCGDGTFTIELFDRAGPSSIYAFDPASKAIEAARRKTGDRAIEFAVNSAYEIPVEDQSFDVAHLRGVLHHMDHPDVAIREALRVAKTIVVLEPNGYNVGLKVIEKLSKYHREHGEKSYPPARIEQWVRQHGGVVNSHDWVCLVPYFCPDWFARTMKVIEPIVEFIPVVDRLGCGTFVMAATRKK
jgi:ubiquinone/menaquinone biosynthesis C-methylase UbiE